MMSKDIHSTIELIDYLKPTLEKMDAFVYIRNASKEFIYCNQKFYDLFSLKREDVLGRTTGDLFPKDILEKLNTLDNAVLLHNCGTTFENISFFEGKKTFCITKFPICDNRGVSQAIATFGFDITLAMSGEQLFTNYLNKVEEANVQLNAARELAEETNLSKTNFLINISHELRTPLNGIIGAASLLAKTDPDPTQKKFIDIITRSGKILLQLINDLFDTTKIEIGQVLIEKEIVSIRETISALSDLFEIMAAIKGLKYTLNIDPKVPALFLIPVVRLQQVINNMLSNALKFTHEGEIQLNVSMIKQVEDYALIRIEVKDTGAGIPKDKQHRVFERFWQLNSNADSQTSAGLGLAISKQLMERMNGMMGFESEEGKGTTFWIELPLKIVSGVIQDESQK